MDQPIELAAEARTPPAGDNLSVRVQLHRDVERPGGVGEGAERDDIDAGLGDGADGGEGDAAGRLRERTAAAAGGHRTSGLRPRAPEARAYSHAQSSALRCGCRMALTVSAEGYMNKSELLEIIGGLPDDGDIDVDKLIYTLHVRREIDRGLADADAGREVSLEEIDQMLDEWPE